MSLWSLEISCILVEDAPAQIFSRIGASFQVMVASTLSIHMCRLVYELDVHVEGIDENV